MINNHLRGRIANAIPPVNSILQLTGAAGFCEYDAMIDPREQRLEKLKVDVAKFDSVAAFARQYDLDVTYIRQLLNRHRPFGERAAKKMGAAIAGDEAYFFGTANQEWNPPQESAKVRRLPVSSEMREAHEIAEVISMMKKMDAVGVGMVIQSVRHIAKERAAAKSKLAK